MSRKGSVAASSIRRGSGNSGGGKRIATGGQAKGGNASIKRGGGSKRIDMKNLTTGSNIKPSRTRGYDQGMHTGSGAKANTGKVQGG